MPAHNPNSILGLDRYNGTFYFTTTFRKGEQTVAWTPNGALEFCPNGHQTRRFKTQQEALTWVASQGYPRHGHGFLNPRGKPELALRQHGG